MEDSHAKIEEDINSEDDLEEEDTEENNQVKKQKWGIDKVNFQYK